MPAGAAELQLQRCVVTPPGAKADECESEGEPQMGTHLATDGKCIESAPPAVRRHCDSLQGGGQNTVLSCLQKVIRLRPTSQDLAKPRVSLVLQISGIYLPLLERSKTSAKLLRKSQSCPQLQETTSAGSGRHQIAMTSTALRALQKNHAGSSHDVANLRVLSAICWRLESPTTPQAPSLMSGVVLQAAAPTGVDASEASNGWSEQI